LLYNIYPWWWKLSIDDDKCSLSKTCWKNEWVQLHVNSSNSVHNHSESHMHIFNVSITTVQGFKNVSLNVWEELITQSWWQVPFNSNMLKKWLSSTTCKFFQKCPNTSKASHSHIQCVHNKCARFEECQLKGVGGVDYTKWVPSIQNMLKKWLSSTTCKFFEKCPNTSKASHAHLQCVHNNCARFEECPLKGVGGVNYTK
jgi:hypothetical protein